MDHDDAMRMLKAMPTAFDEHDLEGIMVHFANDATLEGRVERTRGRIRPREDPRGLRRPLLRIPDIRYQEPPGTSSTVTAGHPSGPCPER